MAIDDCPTYPHIWSPGDTLPAIGGVLKGVDITGWTVELHIERPTTTLVKVATLLDATQGSFSIDWVTADLVAGQNQLAIWRMTNAGGAPQTPARMLIDVEPLPS